MGHDIWRRGTLALALALGPTAAMPATAQPLPGVELRLGVRAPLDDMALRLAESTAGQLLSTAGIRVAWRSCASGACAAGATPADPSDGVAIVHLMPVFKMNDRAVSGETVRDQRSQEVTILVYVPRLVELVGDISRAVDGRSHPALATLEVGHLVGLTIAHEVGHGLGLPHASSGVMKARPSLAEIVALRSSTLSFRDTEAARMRLTLVTRPDGQLARGR